jgi:hypothetical protein
MNTGLIITRKDHTPVALRVLETKSHERPAALAGREDMRAELRQTAGNQLKCAARFHISYEEAPNAARPLSPANIFASKTDVRFLITCAIPPFTGTPSAMRFTL